MAKVDHDVPVHPLVEHFPISHALRHLANDPKNSGRIRDLSKVALTKDPSALWGLHDALQEENHPAQGWYSWINAADKLELDRLTYHALSRTADDLAHHEGVDYSHGEQREWEHRPEGVAQAATFGMEKGSPYRRLHDIVIANAKRFAPEADNKAIEESIRRHYVRASAVYDRELGIDDSYHRRRALGNVEDHELHGSMSYKNLKATRYRRRYAMNARGDFKVIRHTRGQGTWFTLTKDSVPVAHVGGFDKGRTFDIIRAHANPDIRGSGLFQQLLETAASQFPDGVHSDKFQTSRSFEKAMRKMPGYKEDEHRHYVAQSGGKTLPVEEGHFQGYELEEGEHPRWRPKKYALNARGDFIDSLRRVRSRQQQQLRRAAAQVADRLGLHPTTTLDALHDSPDGAAPGLAQAIYSPSASPEAINAAAAYLAMVNNSTGFGVFHVRPMGKDFLHRFRQEGSGLELRARLDRAGLTNRVLVPHRKGFDVLLPDPGGQLLNAVRGYTKQHGVELQTSPGFFSVVGDADQSRAREMFRGTVAKMSRAGRPWKYMQWSHADFLRKMLKNQEDRTAPLVYADWLDENGQSAAAEIIRKHNSRETRYAWMPGSLQTGIGPVLRGKPPGTFHLYITSGGKGVGKSWYSAILEQKTGLRNPGTMYWSLRPSETSKDHIARLADGIIGAGGIVTGDRPPKESGGTDYGHQQMSRGTVRRFARPGFEEGPLTEDHLSIIRHAGGGKWIGVLGDKLQDEGHENAGSMLSEHHRFDGGGSEGGVRRGFIHDRIPDEQMAPGTFRYRSGRDGADILHVLDLKMPSGNVFKFWKRVPSPPRPTAYYSAASSYTASPDMAKHQPILSAKRRRIVRAAQARYVDSLRAMPPEQLAQKIADHVTANGPSNRRQLMAKFPITAAALDAAAEHARANGMIEVTRRPGLPTGGGPPTTWYSPKGV